MERVFGAIIIVADVRQAALREIAKRFLDYTSKEMKVTSAICIDFPLPVLSKRCEHAVEGSESLATRRSVSKATGRYRIRPRRTQIEAV